MLIRLKESDLTYIINKTIKETEYEDTVTEATATIALSQEDMDKLHGDGSIDVDGVTITYQEPDDELEELDEDGELDEQDDGGGTGTSSAGQGAGTAAMGIWASGVARGVGNQIGVTSQSSGYASIGRGKGNPLWESNNKNITLKEVELVSLIKRTLNRLK